VSSVWMASSSSTRRMVDALCMPGDAKRPGPGPYARLL
jgi:hypothetical protein